MFWRKHKICKRLYYTCLRTSYLALLTSHSLEFCRHSIHCVVTEVGKKQTYLLTTLWKKYILYKYTKEKSDKSYMVSKNWSQTKYFGKLSQFCYLWTLKLYINKIQMFYYYCMYRCAGFFFKFCPLNFFSD